MSKRQISTLLAIAALAGAPACESDRPSAQASASPNAAPAQANAQEAVFRVDGMSCASCNVTVKVAAERVAGVRSARADADAGRAWVTYDPAVATPEQIAAAISETGYKATPLQAKASDAASAGAGKAEQASGTPPPEDKAAQEVACRVLREGVYGLWPELGRAPRAREIARALSMKESEVNRALDLLGGEGLPCGSIERPKASDRIVFAWPFSNVPTESIVTIRGKKPVYGRCAIDALGVSAMYGKSVEIEATSIGNGKPIRIAVDGDRLTRVEPKSTVVWLGGEGCGCDEMLFFASREELAEWRRELGKPEGKTLSLEEATAHGIRSFGNRLRAN